MTAFTESVVEDAALDWLKATGWQVAHGPDIAPEMPAAERRNYGEVVLNARLRDALARLNPTLPAEALEDGWRKLTRPEGADLIQRNRALHRLLVNGVTVEYRTPEGEVRGAQARVIDFDKPASNDWLAVNQFSLPRTSTAAGRRRISTTPCGRSSPARLPPKVSSTFSRQPVSRSRTFRFSRTSFGRSARDAAAEPRGRAVAETPEG